MPGRLADGVNDNPSPGARALADSVNDNPLPGDRALADSVNDNPRPAPSDDLRLEMPPQDIHPIHVTREQAIQAAKLARSGAADPPEGTVFMPLGVFSFAPEGQTQATAVVHLAVSKAGLVRGTYYDLLADQDIPIYGAVDKKTQQVAFMFGPRGKVVFETSLANLAQNTGAVATHFEDGNVRRWIVARYDKEPTDEATTAPDSSSK